MSLKVRCVKTIIEKKLIYIFNDDDNDTENSNRIPQDCINLIEAGRSIISELEVTEKDYFINGKS